MQQSFVERQVENIVGKTMGDGAARVVRELSHAAAKQGGETTIENYQMLGKRAFITLGVAILAVEVASGVVGYIVSRKMENRRIEQTVRRVMAEERMRA